MARKSRYTENDFINKCNQLNLEYIGNHKVPHDGTIIEYVCPKHRDKGVQNATWSHFKDAKIGCPYCYGRHKTNDDIIPLIKDKKSLLAHRV